MRKLLVPALVLLLILGIICIYFISNGTKPNFSITSPLPQLLTHAFPQTVEAGNAWKPRREVLSSSVKKPDTTSTAIGLYDLTLDKFLFQENVDNKLPIASLTKIMTAIVALENMDLDQKITVDQKAATIGEGTMGLTEGEILTLEELLYGLLLQSGNDAGEAIAAASPFGRDNFVYLMNKKAEEMGLTNTHFTNPTGLEGDGEQYGTVEDLIVMTRYALQIPKFAEIVSTYEHYIEPTDKNPEHHLYNETNLLTTYSGVKGVKTGYTNEAGMCLITYLDYGGHKIIGVVLNAENRREEMKNLLDYSLKSVGVAPPPHN